jgi:hypothetical protein
MRIWVYTVCYNEQHFVKNFLEAYKNAERIIAYDNQSTDDTVKLLLEDPRVTVRSWDSGNQIRDDKYLEIKNNCWKEARGLADWAIIVDFDEIFSRVAYMPDHTPIFDLDLSEPYNQGATIIKPYGYNMVSLDAPLGEPGHPYTHCPKGVYHWPQEKPCCFRPDMFTEINFVPGCHGMEPIGTVNVCNRPEYKLLHFKLWNLRYYLSRTQLSATRLSAVNIEKGWGEHYRWPLERHKNSFLEAYRNSKYLYDIIRSDKLYV